MFRLIALVGAKKMLHLHEVTSFILWAWLNTFNILLSLWTSVFKIEEGLNSISMYKLAIWKQKAVSNFYELGSVVSGGKMWIFINWVFSEVKQKSFKQQERWPNPIHSCWTSSFLWNSSPCLYAVFLLADLLLLDIRQIISLKTLLKKVNMLAWVIFIIDRVVSIHVRSISL